MTEGDAREWVRTNFGVSRETLLERFDVILRREATHQNLIAASTLDTLWARHLVDSAQLVPLAVGAGRGAWVDVGSGAGLPGLVVAILLDRPLVLVEPRARRVAFLREAAAELGLEKRVTVQGSKIESYHPVNRAAVVSARAVAELSQLILSTQHCTDSSTVWLLPKGRNAHSEVEAARSNWQGSFHVEPSITQPDSGIVIAQGVRPR
ncbi:16S rRNA (guanine(527)-N(7))-methyltransferase RsmG [Sphingomonas sp. JC676]|uniref:16S rRNA (guanine(527)-N(7))-methyltransferase RsmG n=1 Tax=Sphingomonas sp. JC676 TaxID=2768065 RepID=UPI00165809B3|nr:16S rRNA (guanine(527)-N(7))-methyltransferase RsmG [Sphingomonas sp. JC676]MBC9034604.1 16S rRNA (guanine(527)-N(7))-methyltransferase RsmG [Sphingomonas sp. JC676]